MRYEIKTDYPYNCWAAKIVGIGGQYGFQREFVSQKSFVSSSSKRSYFDYFFELEPNTIYEVSVGKYAKENRYFIKTDVNCNVTDISKADVINAFKGGGLDGCKE